MCLFVNPFHTNHKCLCCPFISLQRDELELNRFPVPCSLFYWPRHSESPRDPLKRPKLQLSPPARSCTSRCCLLIPAATTLPSHVQCMCATGLCRHSAVQLMHTQTFFLSSRIRSRAHSRCAVARHTADRPATYT